MGAALTALAVRYPGATLLGVEPDPGNAALAARNVAAFGDRCKVRRSRASGTPTPTSSSTATPATASTGSRCARAPRATPPGLPGIKALEHRLGAGGAPPRRGAGRLRAHDDRGNRAPGARRPAASGRSGCARCGSRPTPSSTTPPPPASPTSRRSATAPGPTPSCPRSGSTRSAAEPELDAPAPARSATSSTRSGPSRLWIGRARWRSPIAVAFGSVASLAATRGTR